jgi:hypothetical protein
MIEDLSSIADVAQEQAALRSSSPGRARPPADAGAESHDQRRITMADSQADGRTLAERYVTMMNEHNPDGVDSFVAVDYINHNRSWRTDVKATGSSGQLSSLRFQTSK